MAEMTEKRKHAIRLIQHPLNRKFYEKLVAMLEPGGTYGFPAMLEVFSKEELVEILAEGAKFFPKDECILKELHLTNCDEDGHCKYCGFDEGNSFE